MTKKAIISLAPQVEAPPAPAPQTQGKRLMRRQCTGTWSHTSDPTKRAPGSMPKHEFGELLLSTCERLSQASHGEGKRQRINKLDKCSVSGEKHKTGFLHYHFPIKYDEPCCFLALARALRAEGIYVNFSPAHEYYWTSFAYLNVPDAMPGGKLEADIDHDPWLSPGHPSVRDTLEDMPRGARANDKVRVRRYLQIDVPGTDASKNAALTDKEFKAHLIDLGLRTLTALQAWVEVRSLKLRALSTDERLLAVGMEACWSLTSFVLVALLPPNPIPCLPRPRPPSPLP